MAENLRIGDGERNEAVELLQEHHAAGRLSAQEFNDRMSKALEAKTAADLTLLFTDLPGAKPGQRFTQPNVPMAEPIVQPWGEVSTPPTPQLPHKNPNGLNQWWLYAIPVVLLVMISQGRMWFLIILFVLFFTVIKPSMDKSKALRQNTQAPRPLTYEERDRVLLDLRAGNKVLAIKRYREMTGADLYTAKMTIEAWGREIGR